MMRYCYCYCCCWLINKNNVQQQYNIQGHKTYKYQMQSSKKQSKLHKNNANIDTTLSMRPNPSTQMVSSSKPMVSSFSVAEMPEKVRPFDVQSDGHVEQVVRNMNYEYIQLFYHIFKNSSKLCQVAMPPSDQANKSEKLSKQQRCQLECMKVLEQCGHMIASLKQGSTVMDNWKAVGQYVRKADIQLEQTQTQSGMAHRLIQIYQNTTAKAQNLSHLHRNLTRRHNQIPHQHELQYQHQQQHEKMTSQQKQYHRNLHKLTKLTKQQLYYEQRCARQQHVLESLDARIQQHQANANLLQIKLVAETGARDRAKRKLAQLKQQVTVPHQRRPGAGVNNHNVSQGYQQPHKNRDKLDRQGQDRAKSVGRLRYQQI